MERWEASIGPVWIGGSGESDVAGGLGSEEFEDFDLRPPTTPPTTAPMMMMTAMTRMMRNVRRRRPHILLC